MTISLRGALCTMALAAGASLMGGIAGCADPQADAPAKSLAASKTRGAADQDDPQNTSQVAIKQGASNDSASLDSLIPNGSTDELLTFIRRLDAVRFEEDTREARARFTKVQRLIVEGANRLLAKKDLGESARIEAVQLRWTAAAVLFKLDDENAEERFLKIANEQVRDPNPKLARIARLQLRQFEIVRSLHSLMVGTTKNANKLREDVGILLTEEDLGPVQFQLLSNAARMLESLEQYDEALNIYASMESSFKKSGKSDIAAVAAEMAQTAATRLGWFGKTATLSGTRLDGEPFDLGEYKGKVVLIDFWATWCGPCLAELPNVKKNYEKYRDRGFEVVGVSRDSDKDDVVTFVAGKNPTKGEIPWVMLWADESSDEAEKNSLAAKFGVDGLPQTFLVDQEGKVVSIGIRGERLGERLAELLGAPDEPQDTAAAGE